MVYEQSLQPEEHLPPETLEKLGVIGKVFAGIQVDMNVVYRKRNNGEPLEQIHVCNHSCTTEHGNYDCPSAFTLEQNRRPNMATLVSMDSLLHGLSTSAEGLQMIRDAYLEELHIQGYPETLIRYIERHAHGIEINLFGGNPEMYPRIEQVITRLKEQGFIVNFTTTGGKFFSSGFADRICATGVDRIAVSADDLPIDSEMIRNLAHMNTEQLKATHSAINPLAGQKRKAVEAIHVANLSHGRNDFPEVIFNFVIHPGNLAYAIERMELLGELYPHIKINAYPAQSGFMHGESVFTKEQVQQFEHIIDYLIERHMQQVRGNDIPFHVVPRLHYFLLLKAIYQAYPGNVSQIAHLLSGYNTWQCYHHSILSNRYLQIGASSNIIRPSQEEAIPEPGGHPGCFWTEGTVTDSTVQVWNTNPATVREHVSRRMSEFAAESHNPCPGCLMPRLVFDEPSLRGGIPDARVLQAYLDLCKKYLGF